MDSQGEHSAPADAVDFKVEQPQITETPQADQARIEDLRMRFDNNDDTLTPEELTELQSAETRRAENASESTEAPSPTTEGETDSESAQTEAAEDTLSPEEIQLMRRNEAQRVVHAQIARTGIKAREGTNLTESQQAAFSYQQFSNELMMLPAGKLIPPKPIEGGNPLFVQKIGGRYIATESGQSVSSIIAKVEKPDGIYFTCMVDGREEDIAVSEVLNSQILSEQTYLTEIFPPNSAEARVMANYLEHLKDRNTGITVDADTMHEAGKNTGLMDAKGLEATIRRNTEEGSELQQELVGYLDGQLIADPQTAGVILSRLNMTGPKIEQIEETVQKKQAEIQNLRIQIESITDDNEGTRALKNQLQMMIGQLQGEIGNENGGLTKQLADLKYLQEKMPADDMSMIRQVAKMYDGTVDAETAHKVNEALKSGDIDKLLTEMIGGLPVPPEKKAEFDKLRNIALTAGGSALAILLVMLMNGMKEG